MNRYEECRLLRNMSQKFVALSVGVSPPMVSQWESGAKEPSKETLLKLANLFDVTTDYLLGRDDNQKDAADFPQRFLSLRKQFKLTQEKAGEIVNLSQRTVAHWESGKRCPSIPTLIDLAKKFNVSIDYLLGISDVSEIAKKQPVVPEKAKKQPVDQDKLLSKVISRLLILPEPALARVSDFLEGLQSGLEVAAAQAAAPDPDGTPAE